MIISEHLGTKCAFSKARSVIPKSAKSTKVDRTERANNIPKVVNFKQLYYHNVIPERFCFASCRVYKGVTSDEICLMQYVELNIQIHQQLLKKVIRIKGHCGK